MTAILKPIAFLLIIVAAYLVKRAGLFKPRDYRVMRVKGQKVCPESRIFTD